MVEDPQGAPSEDPPTEDAHSSEFGEDGSAQKPGNPAYSSAARAKGAGGKQQSESLTGVAGGTEGLLGGGVSGAGMP